jgi:hypothetical protein
MGFRAHGARRHSVTAATPGRAGAHPVLSGCQLRKFMQDFGWARVRGARFEDLTY